MTSDKLTIQEIRNYLIGCAGHSKSLVMETSENELRGMIPDSEVSEVIHYNLLATI